MIPRTVSQQKNADAYTYSYYSLDANNAFLKAIIIENQVGLIKYAPFLELYKYNNCVIKLFIFMERRKWNYSPICPAVNCDFSDMGNFFIMSASYDLFFISEIKMRFFFWKTYLSKNLNYASEMSLQYFLRYHFFVKCRCLC